MFDDSLPIRNETMTARQRWTILLVSIGGALETFDFVVYGFFAHEIGREFFPVNAAISADTLSFAVLAIGNLSRPIGGIFLGRLGDKYGRRSVFTLSAMVAAVATLLIGMPPSYRACGMGAALSALFGPVFYVTAARHQASLPVLFVTAGIIASFANGTFACAIAELFPVGVCFSGVGTAMNRGLAASIGTAPLIASVLVARTHWPPAPALFMVLCAALAFMASFGMKETRGDVGAL
jgi:MFS family permease